MQLTEKSDWQQACIWLTYKSPSTANKQIIRPNQGISRIKFIIDVFPKKVYHAFRIISNNYMYYYYLKKLFVHAFAMLISAGKFL
jgi:hypothetical protein